MSIFARRIEEMQDKLGKKQEIFLQEIFHFQLPRWKGKLAHLIEFIQCQGYSSLEIQWNPGITIFGITIFPV